MLRQHVTDWRPTAGLKMLCVRARLLGSIRAFFAARGVMEVETPLLSAATVTHVHLHTMSCRYRGPGAPEGRQLYLQSSPEYAMKRLLAAGSGPIYQICKAFRDGESGRQHNPEFTILEWYRPGFDHHRLMDEMDELLQDVLRCPPAQRVSYREAFEHYLGVNPHGAGVDGLRRCARELGLEPVGDLAEKDPNEWLDLLLTHAIQPHLGQRQPSFVYDYPASQAALARIRPGDPPVAERFEVYVEGVELANGFHELTDAEEQRRRFELDLDKRRRLGLDPVPIDERLLAALAAGMPPCAGVALGVDRLMMVAAGVSRLEDVVAFPLSRA